MGIYPILPALAQKQKQVFASLASFGNSLDGASVFTVGYVHILLQFFTKERVVMTGKIVGVGLLLFAPDMSLYVVEELKSKPQIGKKAGMFSFPLETREDKDRTLTDTIWRLVEEETPYSKNEIELLNIHHEPFHLIPGRPEIETWYGCALFCGDLDLAQYEGFVPADEATRFAGWMQIEELLQREVRVETKPILGHFLGSANFRKMQQVVAVD